MAPRRHLTSFIRKLASADQGALLSWSISRWSKCGRSERKRRLLRGIERGLWLPGSPVVVVTAVERPQFRGLSHSGGPSSPWFASAPSAPREKTRVVGPSGAGAWKEGRSQDPSGAMGKAIPRPGVEKGAAFPACGPVVPAEPAAHLASTCRPWGLKFSAL